MNPSEPRNAALKADPRLDAYFSDEDERRRVTRALFDQAAAQFPLLTGVRLDFLGQNKLVSQC